MSDQPRSDTIDDVLLRMHLRIESTGWALTTAEAGPEAPCWTYTTGLCARFGHPELIVASVGAERAADLIDRLCGSIRDGERFVTGREVDAGGGVAHLVEVHPAQFDTAFSRWYRYYGSIDSSVPTLQALQVVVPDVWFPEGRAGTQPRLDAPGPVLGRGRAKRAERPTGFRAGPSRPVRPRRW